MTQLRSTDPSRPSEMTPEQESYIRSLEARLEERSKPIFKGWPAERWLTVATLICVLGGGIAATVIRWHDVDLIAERETQLEHRLESLPQAEELLYVRKDINDERMKSINEKLDTLIADVKVIKGVR